MWRLWTVVSVVVLVILLGNLVATLVKWGYI